MSDNRRDFSAKADAPEEQTQVPVTKIEGRNPVLEALCSGRTIDKLYVLDGCRDSAVQTILRKARRQDTIVSFVSRERLDQISETHHHQGVIAMAAAPAPLVPMAVTSPPVMVISVPFSPSPPPMPAPESPPSAMRLPVVPVSS